MPATIQYQAADLILAAIGAVPSAVAINLLVAWMEQEYTAADLAATNNPLATSQQSTGAVGYCTLPSGETSSEPCYDTLAHGAAACADTLRNGLYGDLLAGLQAGSAGTFLGSQGLYELAVWAGGPGAPNYAYAQAVASTYAGLPAPPSWALAAIPPVTPPGTTPPLFPAPNPWLTLALLGGAGGGLALAIALRNRG